MTDRNLELIDEKNEYEDEGDIASSLDDDGTVNSSLLDIVTGGKDNLKIISPTIGRVDSEKKFSNPVSDLELRGGADEVADRLIESLSLGYYPSQPIPKPGDPYFTGPSTVSAFEGAETRRIGDLLHRAAESGQLLKFVDLINKQLGEQGSSLRLEFKVEHGQNVSWPENSAYTSWNTYKFTLNDSGNKVDNLSLRANMVFHPRREIFQPVPDFPPIIRTLYEK